MEEGGEKKEKRRQGMKKCCNEVVIKETRGQSCINDVGTLMKSSSIKRNCFGTPVNFFFFKGKKNR